MNSEVTKILKKILLMKFADTHNFNEAMIVCIQFVPEPSEGNSLLIDNTSCYTFTCNLK